MASISVWAIMMAVVSNRPRLILGLEDRLDEISHVRTMTKDSIKAAEMRMTMLRFHLKSEIDPQQVNSYKADKLTIVSDLAHYKNMRAKLKKLLHAVKKFIEMAVCSKCGVCDEHLRVVRRLLAQTPLCINGDINVVSNLTQAIKAVNREYRHIPFFH